MDRFVISMLIAVVISAVCTAGASSENGAASVAGAILPFTGAQSDIASEEKNATELALEDSGGDVRIVYRDSAGLVPDAARALQELAEKENASVVITCASWISNAVDPLAAQRGIVQLSIASATLNRSEKSRDVQFTVSIDEESKVLLKFLENRSRVAVIYMDNDYGNGWAGILQAGLWPRLKASERYNLSQTSYAGELTRIKAAAPDVLVLLSSREGTEIARQAREMGISCQIASTRPIERPEILSEPAMEGLVYTSPSFNASHPFVAEYREKYGQEPTVFGAEAYDAVRTLDLAARECGDGGKSDCIYQWYLGRNYTGALGEIRFDQSGSAHYPVVLKEVRGGKIIVR
jgi:branched-chain amino acid transport system substrate-binding protein